MLRSNMLRGLSRVASQRLASTASFWSVESKYSGLPKPTDFRLETESLPSLSDGQFLAEAVAWSVDPYQQAYVSSPLGGGNFKFPFRQFGYQVAKVTESKNDDFPVGSQVVSHIGWCSHAVMDAEGPVGFKIFMNSPPFRVPQALTALPSTYMLGVLGMPGITAYFGVQDILKPTKGETMLVTGAAGAVGTVVGQLGKAAGSRVIGFVGSDAKAAWLEKELGFDRVFNYKKAKTGPSLADAAPDGIDTFFDNVGGDIADEAYKHLALDSRVAQCGAISGYSAAEAARIPDFRGILIRQRALIAGLHMSKYLARFPEAIQALAAEIQSGRLKPAETKWQGLDTLPKAFVEMLTGANTGKAVVEA